MADFDLREHLILLALGGSRVCGLHTESSDVDIMGIACPPFEEYIKLGREWEQDDSVTVNEVIKPYLSVELLADADRNGLEGSIYNIKKYVNLAAKCNPTIWQTIFCRDEDLLYITEEGEILRRHRDLFISQKARDAYVGYAIAQLKKIRRHKKWLDDPPTKPSREAYGLPKGGSLLNKEQLQAFCVVSRAKLRELGMSDNLVDYVQAERAYHDAADTWKQYRVWKQNRNPVRAELEANAGYDTKHAMHLVRLLRMGREIVETGKVNVYREDREELLAIRDGRWEYERLVEWGDLQIEKIDEFMRAGKCELPKSPSVREIAKVYKAVVLYHLKRSNPAIIDP